MIGEKIPLFCNGTILTKEMLDLLREYAMAVGAGSYEGYSDGILNGCAITTTENSITVNEGMILYKGQIYIIDEPLTHAYYPTNQWMVFKISFLGEETSDTFLKREIRVCVAPESENSVNDIEICRFKLQNGAKLRKEYKSFLDLTTEYDTIHEIHAKWAGYKEASISPRILQKFYEEAVNIPEKEMVDLIFLHQIAETRGNTLNRKTIILYLSEKMGWEYKDYHNTKIYEGLSEALLKIKTGNHRGGNQEKRERRIIVD